MASLKDTFSPRKQTIIALDGLDYSGKSTLARKLSAALSAMGYRVMLHAHPCGTTDTGIYARRMLLTSAQNKIIAEAMADDFMHTMDNVITDDYDIVILDRWIPVTMVNQGDEGRETVLSRRINHHPKAPNFYITLTTDYETARSRMIERRKEQGVDWDDAVSAPLLASPENWYAAADKYLVSAELAVKQTAKDLVVNMTLDRTDPDAILNICASIKSLRYIM